MAAAGPAAAFAPNKHLAGRPSSGLPSDTPMAGAQSPASAATCASVHLRQLQPNGSAPRPFIPRSLIVSAPTATAANESAADTTTASMGSWRLAYALKQQRDFGVKRVVQKRRHQMRIVHPKQEPFLPPPASASGDPPKPPQPLPLSLVNSGPVRRLLYSGSAAAAAAAAAVDWRQYLSPCRGVRWHPCGAWRVQFDRRNPQKNFFVRADLYFRVGLYGFSGAKHRAVRYRKRLEMEWEELQETWKALDEQHKLQEQQRMAKRKTHECGAAFLGRVAPLSPFLRGFSYEINPSRNKSFDGRLFRPVQASGSEQCLGVMTCLHGEGVAAAWGRGHKKHGVRYSS
ncbi:uncharacterized protein LOC34623958 [Cyclospora cayetanensis]|uniref:Uncharacterized protein LOC34623958 n=1 Tax=Cyclospora cayetanensis TaxID=88456 RepID=A0A6P6S102_9EIME|nr:uncharacterized protein LOC34623958 [Cyclospora cayetanensis]